MREKWEIGRGRWEENRIRRKEKKMRDHSWSIFQGKKKASISFWVCRVNGSENAAAKLWQAAVCRYDVGRERRNKRARKEWATAQERERGRSRSLKVLEKWRRRGNWSMAMEALLEREILYNWKASLKTGTFLSLRPAVIEKWELADARRLDRERGINEFITNRSLCL